jgi:hypothetical protein
MAAAHACADLMGIGGVNGTRDIIWHALLNQVRRLAMEHAHARQLICRFRRKQQAHFQVRNVKSQ